MNSNFFTLGRRSTPAFHSWARGSRVSYAVLLTIAVLLLGPQLVLKVRADIFVTAEEVGGNTVFNYSGFLTGPFPAPFARGYSPSWSENAGNPTGVIGFGVSQPLVADLFNILGFSFDLSSAGFSIDSVVDMGTQLVASSGDFFSIGSAFGGLLVLPDGYVSGTSLSGSSTFTGNPAFLGLDLNTPIIIDTGFGLVTFFPRTVFTINQGSITSAETTGLGSMMSTLGNVQNAARGATKDLNNRLFRARAGRRPGGPSTASTLDHTSRYLNFARNQNIDYRVALGLADGVDVPAGASQSEGPITATITVPGVNSKSPVSGKLVLDDDSFAKFELFTQADFGFYDQNDLTPTVRGFETDTYSGTVGGEFRISPGLVAGAAYTYLSSDTTSTANLGSSDLDGNLYSAYVTAFRGNSYLDFLYSYGDFDNDITRNTLLGSTALGETESHSHNFELNAGHTLFASEQVSFGPSLGLSYTTGQVDGYTERNGGAANLVYPEHDFESMISRVGGFATFIRDTQAGQLTTQLSAAWAHEFMPENGNVNASLQTSPFALVTGNNVQNLGSFTASTTRPHAGTDWLEVGATTRLDLADTSFHVELGYQGQFFRNNASGHFGSAKIGYEW